MHGHFIVPPHRTPAMTITHPMPLFFVCAGYLLAMSIILLLLGLKVLLWVYALAAWAIVTFSLDRERVKNYII